MSENPGLEPVEAELPAPTPEEADANPAEAQGSESAPTPPNPGENVEAVKAAMQKRIDKLTAERYSLLERLGSQVKPEAKQEPPAPVKAPTLEEHGFDEGKYQQALLDYFEQRAELKVTETLNRREQEAKARQAAETFEKRQADFAKLNPDYIEKVQNNPYLPITQTMADLIRESDVGPEVAMHLAENEELAAAISKLPNHLQAREIGRIEARLEGKKETPAKSVTPKAEPVVSKAPPPPTKVEATNPAPRIEPDSPESDQMSDAEWIARRNKQVAKRRS